MIERGVEEDESSSHRDERVCVYILHGNTPYPTVGIAAFHHEGLRRAWDRI